MSSSPVSPAVSAPLRGAPVRGRYRIPAPSACSARIVSLLIVLVSAVSAAVAVPSGGWQVVPPPATRHGASMAFDSQRGKIVLFGGTSGTSLNTNLNDTWEWDGDTWTRVASTGPSIRHGAAMAYDSRRGRVILFGGLGGSSSVPVHYGDTWEWDGNAWAQVASTGPAPRTGALMAYDSARGMAVLFGGSATGSPAFSDTWEWDGSEWTQAATTGPGPRQKASIAYDGSRGKVVLFGGYTVSGSAVLHDDTWAWDGREWTQVAASGPPPRSGASMAYDSQRGKLVLFGGYGGSIDNILGTYRNDTWEWDGSAWTQAASTGPAVRYMAAMAYDSAHGRVILFGGVGPSHGLSVYGDTWGWDGNAWSQAVASGPSPRIDAAMVYDSARKKVVYYGGIGEGPQFVFGETWEWDGHWNRVTTTGPTPSRMGPMMAYDSQRERVVLFGGAGYGGGSLNIYGDTWEWDGSAWTQVATTGPGPRRWAAMTYDSARGKTVLYGGSTANDTRLGDTWEWDGSVWAQVATTGPGERRGGGMAYDSARAKVVLTGGYGADPTLTWEWDGIEWKQVSTSGPLSWVAAVMAYDSARQKLVLFSNQGGNRCSTWEWDGSGWTWAAAGLGARSFTTMAYDAARGNVVLFGGSGPPIGHLGDTWVYSPATYTVPDAVYALQCAAGLTAASKDSLPLYDVAQTGPSAGRVDLEDAVQIIRKTISK